MADPLSLLRQYHIEKKEIVERNNMIIFGEYCWSKDVKTNYQIYSSKQHEETTKSYYTLECLVYFLNNLSLPHPVYVKNAATLNIPIVQRPDRKDLLSYLKGEVSTSQSIDKSAPIELPKTVQQNSVSSSNSLKPPSTSSRYGGPSAIFERDVDGQAPRKMARMDEMETNRIKKLKDKLDATKSRPSGFTVRDVLGTRSRTDENVSSIREALGNDQLNALIAKRIAKKRSTIIGDIDEEPAELTDKKSENKHLDPSTVRYEAQFAKDLRSKERVWRNRTNILQSSGRNFQKSIFAMLATIKAREEGGCSIRKPGIPGARGPSMLPPMSGPGGPMGGGVPPGMGGPASGTAAGGGAPQQYNRYDQERFTKNDAPSGFRIDTTSSYHGLTLKSVTDGSAQAKSPHSLNGGGSNGLRSSQSGLPQKPQKRVSRTPIIMIPATPTSLITMYNARAILQDLKFIDSKNCDQRRDNEVLIQRRKADNSTVPYRIVDDPKKLNPDDWNRVVAVFVQGPAWQFKDWPWNGEPVEIFARIKAFHLKFDEMKLDNNVAKWSVEIIELSRSKRHLDRANLLKFWSKLDQHIIKYKQNVVRF